MQSVTIEDKMVLDLSGRLELFKRGTHIEIVVRWFGLRTLVSSAIAIGWIIYLGEWYFSGKPIVISGTDINFALHVLVSISLVYTSLAYWLNRTHIRVGMGSLKVSHGPIPWPGRKEILLSDVKQISAVDVEHQKRGDTHEVNVVLRSGGAITLLKNLRSLEEAQIIERRIEQYLRIKDEPPMKEILGGDEVDFKEV